MRVCVCVWTYVDVTRPRNVSNARNYFLAVDSDAGGVVTRNIEITILLRGYVEV